MKKAGRFLTGLMLPVDIISINRNISVQRSFLKKNIAPVLSAARFENDGSLNNEDFKKITDYYGLAVPAILGEAFCALSGKEMTNEERWASTSQGAMTGLFDDFFDKEYLADDRIVKILQDKHLPDPQKKSNEKLFDIFYKKALSYVPDTLKMKESLKEVYHAQIASKKQQEKSISEKEITDITYHKGGTSLIFYRSAFSPAAKPEEVKLIYDLGSTMQLANDIFDVYKDREANIRTLITETKHVNQITGLLKVKVNEYFANACNIGFPKGQVRKFLAILSLGIYSRAFVCLEQLQQNEINSGNIFLVNKYSRKQLICDMDTKKNMLRSAAYHIKLMS